MHDPIDSSTVSGGVPTGFVDNRPYPTFQKFCNYYKIYAYADNWITSAFNKVPTKFENGNADFTDYDDLGRLGMWCFAAALCCRSSCRCRGLFFL